MVLKKVYKPETIKKALKLLNKYSSKGKIIAGGTDLIIQLKENKLDLETLIDISDIKDMKFIKEENDFIEIGANITFTELINNDIINENIKGLKDAAKNIGSPQIRNRGTIGGNICNGSTAADIVPPLLSLDSILTIMNKDKTREIPLEEIYIDNGKVDLKENEILYSIKFIKPSQNLSFVKLGLRKALAITKINISVFLYIDDDNKIIEVRIASGALEKHPIRERNLEKVLKDKVLNNELIDKAKDIFTRELESRLGARYSKEFKLDVSKNILEKALREASLKNKSDSIQLIEGDVI